MKKFLAIALSAISCVSLLTGCGEPPAPSVDQNYTITFVQDGVADVIRQVKSGDELKNPPAPQPQKGYTVVWDTVDFTNITSDITVNAVATPNTYTITYQLATDEAMEGELTQDVTYDAAYELKTPIKYSYAFMGWEADGQTLPQTGTWTIDSNVTLSAMWELNVWTVTFLQNGEEDIVKTVEKGAALTDIPTPKPVDGYDVSWSVTDFSSITQNMTVTVQKKAKTYGVTYTLAADETMEGELTQDVTFGASYTLKTPTKAGYQFVAWKDETEKTIPATGDAWSIPNDVTLKAVWAPNNNTVTFIHADGTTETREITTGQTLTDIPTPKPVEGYTVTWDRTNFSDITGATTVNAVKTANKYTITYADLAGGTMTDTTADEVTFGASYTLKTPVRYGYEFAGWSYEEGKTVAASGDAWAIAKNITVSAVWRDNFYTITFRQNGADDIVKIVENGDTLKATDVPTPKAVKGYDVQWDTTDFSKITSSQVVYAVETAKTFTITYVLKSGETITGEQTIEVTFGEAYRLEKPTKAGTEVFVSWEIVGSNEKVALSGTFTWESNLQIEATWQEDESWTKNY